MEKQPGRRGFLKMLGAAALISSVPNAAEAPEAGPAEGHSLDEGPAIQELSKRLSVAHKLLSGYAKEWETIIDLVRRRGSETDPSAYERNVRAMGDQIDSASALLDRALDLIEQDIATSAVQDMIADCEKMVRAIEQLATEANAFPAQEKWRVQHNLNKLDLGIQDA